MIEIDMSELGADASDLLNEQKREIEKLFRVSFEEVGVEAPSIRELVKRLINHIPAVIDACMEGYDSALEVLFVLRKLKQVIESEDKVLTNIAIAEASIYSNTELKQFGFSRSEKSDTLDYSQDEYYQQIKSQLEERKGKLKAVYGSYEKGLESKTFVDEETGEEVPKVGIKVFGGQILTRLKKNET